MTWTVSFSGGVNFEVKIGSEDAGGSVGAGAHASGGASLEESQPLVPGPGAHGCGKCVQAFQELTVCKKFCTIHKWQRQTGRTLGGGYVCADEPCSMACIKATGTSVERCSRTGC